MRTDFLIKGGAGTGKTIVLIKSLEKAVALQKTNFIFGEQGSCLVNQGLYNKTYGRFRFIFEKLQPLGVL